MVEQNEKEKTPETPDQERDFAGLLIKHNVKSTMTANIAEHIAHTGGPKVFEDPELLGKALTEWSEYASPQKRTRIIKHWFAEKGITVPEEVLKETGMSMVEREKHEKQVEKSAEKYTVDPETGRVQVATTSDKTALTIEEAEKLSKNIKRELAEKHKGEKATYVYDTEAGEVRMTREGETGGTLEQAKELKRMAKEGKGGEVEESPFTMDENGNWILNPKAKVTGIEMLAFEAIRGRQEKGEPVDPLEELTNAAEKVKTFQEIFSGGGREQPDWLSDPLQFIKAIREISGGEGKGDDAVKTELSELRKTLSDMQEDRRREEIANLQAQIRQQAEASQQQINQIMDKIGELGHPVTGRTEMDIIHEVATEGIGAIKAEAAGMRGLIKDALGSTALPTIKSPEQREQRHKQYREALEKDEDLEKLGRRLFFNE